MSSTAVSTAPSASGTSCSTADFTRFPTQDIACAVGSTQGIPSNTSEVLESCCKSAPLETFNGDCGWYCLAVQQSVADLQACFMEGGVTPSNIFCSGNQTATATGTPSSNASRTSGSGLPSGTSSAGAEQSTGAAAALGSPQGLNKAGLGMLGMVVVSALAGAML